MSGFLQILTLSPTAKIFKTVHLLLTRRSNVVPPQGDCLLHSFVGGQLGRFTVVTPSYTLGWADRPPSAGTSTRS